MDQDRDYAAITAWLKGTLRPRVPYQSVQVAGPRIQDPSKVTWSRFACLYPNRPTYRLYSAPGTSAIEADEVRAEIAGIVLPDRVDTRFDRARAFIVARDVTPLTEHIGVPLGMYVTGRYRLRKNQSRPVGMLWHIESLPTAFVLERLQHVARG